jgi:ABC-type nitrate/sulfonate/bicarbonate transport system ATPase subunit
VLSARPSRVVHEVTVDLPRPRRDSMHKIALEKAAALEAGILDLLLNS